MIEKLSPFKVSRITKPGMYCDGKGLYLCVRKTLTKSWVFRYKFNETMHGMGLGPLHAVSLLQAREKARIIRETLAQEIDPIQARKEADKKKKAERTASKTFDECASEYISKRKDEWKNDKHQMQWESTLRTYASPHFGRLDVRLIETSHVLKALEPIWVSKTETATRVRERIERVLSWATTLGYRTGDNPARWDGHLKELLPKPGKVRKAQHFSSMPFQQVREFFCLLQKENCIAARALELTILTACRTSEVVNAKWDEFDFSRQIWIIPGERMKAGREHRVPLVDATLAILQRLSGINPIWVFPGGKVGKPLSTMAMLVLLRRMNHGHVTVHGFRSTFRVWAAEMTHHPSELAELALAHSVGTAVEKAYLRSDLFDRRRALMQDWATWCMAIPSEKSNESCEGVQQ